MSQVLMPTATEVNPVFIPYIINEAKSLSRLDDYEIENYADRELMNPEMQDLLMSLPDNVDVDTLDVAPLTLTLSENSLAPLRLFGAKFRSLKRAVKRELCKILGELEADDVIDWPAIITAVLTAIAAAFFAGPVGIVVLPILAAIIAKVIKRGINYVCAL